MHRSASIENQVPRARAIHATDAFEVPSMAPLFAAGMSGLFVLAVTAGLLTLLT